MLHFSSWCPFMLELKLMYPGYCHPPDPPPNWPSAALSFVLIIRIVCDIRIWRETRSGSSIYHGITPFETVTSLTPPPLSFTRRSVSYMYPHDCHHVDSRELAPSTTSSLWSTHLYVAFAACTSTSSSPCAHIFIVSVTPTFL